MTPQSITEIALETSMGFACLGLEADVTFGLPLRTFLAMLREAYAKGMGQPKPGDRGFMLLPLVETPNFFGRSDAIDAGFKSTTSAVPVDRRAVEEGVTIYAVGGPVRIMLKQSDRADLLADMDRK